ncbi:MAG: hypothetical protein IKX25_05235 [Bacteroidales bacterium]|nr:hypothetical protein [Bacteroidales bacterium]
MNNPFAKIGNVPFDLSVLQTLFPDNKHITDKARSLESAGSIIRLKNGLYVADTEETGQPLSLELIANHLYGPSYVSRHTALRYYGLIPEHVYLIQSVTTKQSRRFTNSTGVYDYQHCSASYFPLGIRIEQISDRVSFLMATPEKALCDLIAFSPKLSFRFMSDIHLWLEEDMRFDMDALSKFEGPLLEEIAQESRKRQSINTLIKFLKHEKYI